MRSAHRPLTGRPAQLSAFLNSFCLQRLKAHCEQQKGEQQRDENLPRRLQWWVEGPPPLTPDQGLTAPQGLTTLKQEILFLTYRFVKKYMLKVKINTYHTECVTMSSSREKL